ncbi:MAG: T9SS type A sorting domain-containing protein, partial [Rubricoccaceae bacterium]|nr:T9SS type A sorting domain-containing protein [Rubricoccaceae bacterium]
GSLTSGNPQVYMRSPAYPNPFNPQSQFELSVVDEQRVTAELFNVVGQRVATLFSGTVQVGQSQRVTIDGAGLPSGMYLVRITGERFTDTFRVTLLK